MNRIFDCSDSEQLMLGMRLSRQAIAKGQLVVMPTDTVYGVAADAFSPEAVRLLLEAKGRGIQSPPPVLIPSLSALYALATNIPEPIVELAEKFWPGGLTIVLDAQPSLAWDLGETFGTVALRMPNNPIALELLAETGPLAVSSANLTGNPAARSAHDAYIQLGARVEIYLEAGQTPSEVSSTIIDATALSRGLGKVKILREGAVLSTELLTILGENLDLESEPT